MRDPKRIPEVLEAIREYWEKYPDLRLGQLLINMIPDKDDKDVYYLEDDELIKRLKMRIEAVKHLTRKS